MLASYTGSCEYYDESSFRRLSAHNHPGLSALHMNARSMKNKKDNIDIFLESLSFSFDIMAFTETWLSEGDVPLSFAGYKSKCLSRRAKRGGGIAIYFKSCFSAYVIEEFSLVNDDVECLVIHAGAFIVATAYRPPSGNKTDCIHFFDNLFCFLNSSAVPFFVMGDLNINMAVHDTATQQFHDVLVSYGCNNTITRPTRITLDTSTLLDVCVTNLNNADTISGIFPVDLSDHF